MPIASRRRGPRATRQAPARARRSATHRRRRSASSRWPRAGMTVPARARRGPPRPSTSVAAGTARDQRQPQHCRRRQQLDRQQRERIKATERKLDGADRATPHHRGEDQRRHRMPVDRDGPESPAALFAAGPYVCGVLRRRGGPSQRAGGALAPSMRSPGLRQRSVSDYGVRVPWNIHDAATFIGCLSGISVTSRRSGRYARTPARASAAPPILQASTPILGPPATSPSPNPRPPAANPSRSRAGRGEPVIASTAATRSGRLRPPRRPPSSQSDPAARRSGSPDGRRQPLVSVSMGHFCLRDKLSYETTGLHGVR